MKFLFTFIIFFNLTLIGSEGKPIDIVIDIDGVLVLSEGRELPVPIQDVLIRMGVLIKLTNHKKIYRVAHGAREFIQSLRHIQNARISFFSAHHKTARAVELLNSLVLPNGKTAARIAHNILFYPSVTEFKYLKPTEQQALLSKYPIFRSKEERVQMKDLRRVSFQVDLNRTLLIDDTVTNAYGNGQERNLVWVKFPGKLDELTRVRGIIDRALSRWNREPIKYPSLPEALFSLQFTHESRKGVDLVYDEKAAVDKQRILESGLKKLKKENPAFTLDASYLKVFLTGDLGDALAAEREMVERQKIFGKLPSPIAVIKEHVPISKCSDGAPKHEKNRSNRIARCVKKIVEAGRILLMGQE